MYYPQRQYPSYTSRQQNSEGVNDFRTVILFGSLGIGTVTGLFFLGRHFIHKKAVKHTEKHSAEEGNPATYAKQLRMAFQNDNDFGWGTNEELVYSTIREIETKAAYAKVQSAYYTLYGKSLNADLEDEMSSDEYNEVIRIISAKPPK